MLTIAPPKPLENWHITLPLSTSGFNSERTRGSWTRWGQQNFYCFSLNAWEYKLKIYLLSMCIFLDLIHGIGKFIYGVFKLYRPGSPNLEIRHCRFLNYMNTESNHGYFHVNEFISKAKQMFRQDLTCYLSKYLLHFKTATSNLWDW